MSEPRTSDVIHTLVADAPIPIVLVDLRRRVVETCSGPMLDLMAERREDVVGRPITSFSMHPDKTTALFDLLVDDRVDGYQAERTLRRGDGAAIECTAWARVLDPEHERYRALLVIGRRCANDDVPASSIDAPAVIGTVDERWRVTSVSTDVEALFGVRPDEVIGADAFAGVHRSDQADLLVTVAAVIAERRAAMVRLRARHRDGRWIRVLLQVALLDDGPPSSYAFTITPVTAADDGDAARLEDHLRRIALEVRAAGIVRIDGSADEQLHDIAHVVDDLTERQWEIVSRLRSGERVPDIARSMYLSPSTVRNHLSAVFGRFGVHSQAELLRVLRSPKDASPIGA